MISPWEQQRQLGVRSFMVRRQDGTTEHVWAHWFVHDPMTGTLTFIRVDEMNEREALPFPGGTWLDFYEHVHDRDLKERKIH